MESYNMEPLRLVPFSPCNAFGIAPAVEGVGSLLPFMGEPCSPADTPVCLFTCSRAFGRFRCLADMNRIRLCTTRKVWSFGVFVSEEGFHCAGGNRNHHHPSASGCCSPNSFGCSQGVSPHPCPTGLPAQNSRGGSAYSPEHSLCAALSSPSCALIILAAFGLPGTQLHLLGPAPLPGWSLQVVTWDSPGARLVSSYLSEVTVLLYLTCSVSNTIASPTLSRLLVISDGG